MGFSVSGATVVVFLAVLVSASTLYPAVDGSREARSEAVSAADERALDQRNTDIQVANVTYDSGNETLTVEVENTGSTSLTVADTDLLVDGTYRDPDAVSVAGTPARSTWLPGETLTLTLTNITSRPARAKLVTGTGVADTHTEVTDG